MWKYYSLDYIKNNRASGTSIRVAAFIAALFLSSLCILFYHFWLDSIAGEELENGSWHARIRGELSSDDLETIRLFANVEKVVVNDERSGEHQTTVDLSFFHKRSTYRDTNAIVDALGLPKEAADYNYQLLSLYFIRIPGDKQPRLLLPAYLAIVLMVCFSLILVLYNSFAVSMNSRIHQFGILSSIGATPGQIQTALIQEALALSLTPILLGLALGTALSFGIVQAMSAFAATLPGGRKIAFDCPAVLLLLILSLCVLTVLISAWIPARKLSRLSPLEAIRGTGELQLSSKKRSRLLSALFGAEGELAGNALKAQKKALRTTSLSLTLAFLGFMLTQCFFTLSGISTNHTYFEKYQDAWDVMVTVKNTRIEDFVLGKKLREVPGAGSVILYQKSKALCRLPQKDQSRALLALGGAKPLAKTSLFILDDESFREFCGQIGIAARLDGTIVLNRFWDSEHSNFRYPKYIPYIKEDLDFILLQKNAEKENLDSAIEIPVLACTQETPILREEYAKGDHDLAQFVPLSLWRKFSAQIGGAETDLFIRVLAENRTNAEALHLLENSVTQIVSREYDIDSENRIQEKLDNEKLIRGYQQILGSFCVLLAIIGIAHVFSHTLGFLRQRKREFARYLSVGVTPDGLRKMFWIEAFVTAGRPMLAALLLTGISTVFLIKASYLNPMEFIRKAPVLPIFLFVLAVFGFVALAYYLGGKKILKMNLAEALRNDS